MPKRFGDATIDRMRSSGVDEREGFVTHATPARVLRAMVCAVAVLTTHGVLSSGQERPLPDLDPFIAQVKKRLQPDADRQAGYAFTERRTEQKLDGAGRVTGETVKVFEVYPGLPGEDQYLRLIEEDGRPVPAADLEKRDRERRRKVERYAREQTELTEADRRKQAREYEKWQKQRNDEIEDVFRVFDIRMTGREPIEGHDTIALTLKPRPNASPRTEIGDIMRRFSVRVWISERDYELVRLHVEAIENVTFGFGLLARIDKGATLTFQRRKVNGEIWLPARTSYRGSARVLLVKGLRRGGTSEFSNYRKFTVDTTTEIGVTR
jgi:hypothetical protein